MDITTQKAPKYDARAGEVISGNLARGGDGKFTRADGSAASGREVINSLIKAPKGGKKAGSKKAGASPDAQAALAQKIGLQSSDASALQQFAKGGALDSDTAARLASSGLVDIGKDGSVRFSDSGKSVARALAKGDERSAADAMSRARDKSAGKQDAEAKRAARQAERDARRAETQARRADAQSKRDSKAQDKSAKKSAAEIQTVTDRVEEIEALHTGDKNVTDAERVRRINQLDKLERRLADAGGDSATQERLDKLRKSLEGESAPAPVEPIPLASKESAEASALTVFKAGDAWRWLGISSNAYEDREREIVSQAALDHDAERMSESGEYGPLRWWHVGRIDIPNPLDYTTVKAGAGVDIGSCDYSVTIGRMALEGGAIYYPEIAEQLAREPGAWQMSRGFAHPLHEPDSSGTYTAIKTFERSILPKGKAANPFTTISATREANSMATIQEKMKALADKFFAGDEAKAQEVIASVTATDKEITASGVAFKAESEPAPDESASAAVEAKAGDMAGAETPASGAEESPEAEDSTEESAAFVGDMTAEEFAGAIVPMLAEAIAKAMASAMAPTMSELSETKEQLTNAQAEIATIKGTKAKEAEALAGSINTLNARVKELEGDAPGAKGYRASLAADTAKDEAALKAKELITEPQALSELERLAAWAVK